VAEYKVRKLDRTVIRVHRMKPGQTPAPPPFAFLQERLQTNHRTRVLRELEEPGGHERFSREFCGRRISGSASAEWTSPAEPAGKVPPIDGRVLCARLSSLLAPGCPHAKIYSATCGKPEEVIPPEKPTVNFANGDARWRLTPWSCWYISHLEGGQRN